MRAPPTQVGGALVVCHRSEHQKSPTVQALTSSIAARYVPPVPVQRPSGVRGRESIRLEQAKSNFATVDIDR
jgi:hypothetical protein